MPKGARTQSKPVARGKNLTARIVHALGIEIVTGRYSHKRPFPVEAELCTKYGASRTVLREAVKMLTAKGLLAARSRQGTWVEPEERWNLFDPDVLRWLLERKFSVTLLIEFTQIRLAVEPAAAAMAAENATPQARAAIQRALNRMVAAEHGEDDPLESDIAFHTSILLACENRFYAQLRELIETALRSSIRTTNSFKGVQLASVKDHKRVLDAIEAGDSAMASRAMRELIEEAYDLMRRGDETKPERMIMRAARR